MRNTETLAELHDCDAAALRHDALLAPKLWTGPKRRRTASASVAEGDADPQALRILKVRGISMEPEFREGDRLVVDTARCVPAPGELFVLWDGTGLVVKRVEAP